MLVFIPSNEPSFWHHRIGDHTRLFYSAFDYSPINVYEAKALGFQYIHLFEKRRNEKSGAYYLQFIESLDTRIFQAVI